MRRIIGIGVIILGAFLALGCAAEENSGGGTQTGATEIDTNSNNTDNPPQADVDPGWTCAADDVGWATAKGTVTNHSSGRSNYIIEVSFTAAGTQYATGTAFLNNVEAGAKAEWETNSLADIRDGTECKLVSVDRFAA